MSYSPYQTYSGQSSYVRQPSRTASLSQPRHSLSPQQYATRRPVLSHSRVYHNEELDFERDDTVLSDPAMVDAALSFPRLRSVSMNAANLVNVRSENLAALMTPALRSWSIEGMSRLGHDRDEKIHLDTLLAGCDSLTTLHFDVWCDYPTRPTFLSILERIHSIKHLDLGDVGEDLARYFPQDFLLQLFNKPRLTFLSFPSAVELSQPTVDTFLARMGRTWTHCSLRSLGKPQFDSGTTAARLLSPIPNLAHPWLTVDRWQTDLEHLFAILDILEKLDYLDMDFNMRACDMDSSWLLKLINLTRLQTFSLDIRDPGAISMTGAQLATFLTSLPALELLSLRLGTLEVSCLPDEKTAIETALSSIETVWIRRLTFTIQDVL